MTRIDLKRNAIAGGVLTVAAGVTLLFFRDADRAELVFNLAAGGAGFLLLFRVLVPVVFTAMNKISTEQMAKRVACHPLKGFFIIEE